MAMTDRHEDDLGLESFFAAARAAAPEPGSALLARIAAQGEAVQAERLSAALAPPRPRRSMGIWATLAAAVGGWSAFGGMATAALAGLWIGFAGSDTLAQAVGLSSLSTASVSDTGSAFLSDADILALAVAE